MSGTKLHLAMAASVLSVGTWVAPLLSSEAPGIEFATVASTSGPYPINAIPCIIATPRGTLVTVWTAHGTEANPKLRIVGARSTDSGRTWSAPKVLVDNPGKTDADPTLLLDGNRILMVSTTLPVPGKILTTEFWVTSSMDEGQTWSKSQLATHDHAYAEGKVHSGYQLKDGRLAFGYSWDRFCEKGMSPSTEGEMDTVACLLFSSDGGMHWIAGGDMYARPERLTPHAVSGMDEPATVVLPNGEIFALLRNGTDHLYQSRSTDSGKTWSTPQPSPLTGHNAPASLWRLRGSSEVVVAWDNDPKNRWPLAVAVSRDNCRSWSAPRVVAAGEGRQVSYPSVTQDSGGNVIVVWQQDLPDRKGREIRLAKFPPSWLAGN